jgi:hypothetical protein
MGRERVREDRVREDRVREDRVREDRIALDDRALRGAHALALRPARRLLRIDRAPERDHGEQEP